MRVAIFSIVIVLAAIMIWAVFATRDVEGRSSYAVAPAKNTASADLTSARAGMPSIEAPDSKAPANATASVEVLQPVSAVREDAASVIQEQSPVSQGSVAAAGSFARNRDTGRKYANVAAECWEIRGESPQDYVVTLDRETRTSGEASALISSLRPTTGYATMFQTASAAAMRGKRVEFSADIRTRGAVGSANLLVRAEDARGRTVAFDNLQTSGADGRPDQQVNNGVKGDSDWSTQHVVLDIPADAAVITYGVSMFNGGKAWIDNARIEVVSSDMATTGVDFRPSTPRFMPFKPESLSRKPANLEFDLEAPSGASPCN